MNYTVEILNKLGVDKNLVSLVLGEMDIPYIGDDFQSPEAYWHPHPPVLIPMFTNYGFAYYGICKHWFIDRRTTFVEFDAEWGFMLEYARNAKQIFAQMILEMDMINDGLNNRILDFAKAVGFDDPESIDLFANQYGNVSEYYSKLESLAQETPLTYLDNLRNYDGDFPSSEKLFNVTELKNACSFEIAKKEYLTIIDDIPKWLDETTNQKELFNKFVKQDNLAGAWLTLNSKTLALPNIAEGLEVLKDKTADSLFHLIAENWIRGWKSSNFFE